MSSENAVVDRPAPRKGTLRAARQAATERRRAESRREIHEKRINQTEIPLHRLSQAFSWLMAECKRKPSQIPRALDVLLNLARSINGGGSGEPADERH